jgi:catechol 2,3-dioxygenase-like lactoylglutathione lyase family enzyme
MIGYVMVGSNDLPRAAAFYDVVLKELGGERSWAAEKYIGWASSAKGPIFMVCRPYDGKPATFGNGTMIALAAASRDQVDRAHARALAQGGKDEGAPGPRGDNFYGAYFRDLDGNKICVFLMG